LTRTATASRRVASGPTRMPFKRSRFALLRSCFPASSATCPSFATVRLSHTSRFLSDLLSCYYNDERRNGNFSPLSHHHIHGLRKVPACLSLSFSLALLSLPYFPFLILCLPLLFSTFCLLMTRRPFLNAISPPSPTHFSLSSLSGFLLCLCLAFGSLLLYVLLERLGF
jgi:hypothetical protein